MIANILAGPLTRLAPDIIKRLATGAVLVHPFDHPDVIAGQGTVGLELLEQCPDLRTVLVSTGGGGIVAGGGAFLLARLLAARRRPRSLPERITAAMAAWVR